MNTDIRCKLRADPRSSEFFSDVWMWNEWPGDDPVRRYISIDRSTH